MQRFKALLPQTRTSLRTLYSQHRAFSAQPNYAVHDDGDSQEQVTWLTFLVCAFSSFRFFLRFYFFNSRRRCLIPDSSRRKSEIASSYSQQAFFSEFAEFFNGTASFFLSLFVFWVCSSEVNAESFSFRRWLDWRGCTIRGKRTLILALFWWRYHCCFHANKLPLN